MWFLFIKNRSGCAQGRLGGPESCCLLFFISSHSLVTGAEGGDFPPLASPSPQDRTGGPIAYSASSSSSSSRPNHHSSPTTTTTTQPPHSPPTLPIWSNWYFW